MLFEKRNDLLFQTKSTIQKSKIFMFANSRAQHKYHFDLNLNKYAQTQNYM